MTIDLLSVLVLLNCFALLIDVSLNKDEVRPIKWAFLRMALRLKPTKIATVLCRVNEWFVNALDAFYWRRGWLTAIARSFAVSIFTIILLLVVFESIDPWRLGWLPAFVLPTVLLFILNLLTDYASLLETRKVLGFAAKQPRRIAVLLGLLGLDLVLTCGLYALGVVFSFWAIMTLANQPTGINWGTMLRLAVNQDPYSPFFYSTFITSVSLYFFVGVSLSLRVGLGPARRPLRKSLRWLGRRNKPVMMCSAFLTLLVVVISRF